MQSYALKSNPVTNLKVVFFVILINDFNKSLCVNAFHTKLLNKEGVRQNNQDLPNFIAKVRVQKISELKSIALFRAFDDNELMRNPYQTYIDWLDHSPLVTTSVTAAVINGLGDLLAQSLEAHVIGTKFIINWTRFNAFFVSGLLFVGPFLQCWFGRLWAMGRWMERKVTKRKIWQIVAQVTVDQTLGVLLFFPTYFYAYEFSEALVSFRAPTWASATEKLKLELVNVFVTQYKVWPVFNMIIFGLVPEHFRVLTSNVVAVFWNAYLCTRVS
mmetsp:Transcript_16221/g.24505  ORF Transcript_16221/g.24505 Transcript_16221/m.24505 type:complete len:272 (-) Transcript_16221:171-986(-)